MRNKYIIDSATMKQPFGLTHCYDLRI